MNRLLMWFLATGIGSRIQLQLLMNVVTSSLSLQSVCVLMKSQEKALDTFAQLTAHHLPSANRQQQERLSIKARRLGSRLRKVLTDRSPEALTSLVFLLYRNIGIDMNGHLPGTAIVSSCFFSQYYSSLTCKVALLMDAGVICGLYGGGQLSFSQRITEGKGHCCLEYLRTIEQ